MIEIVYKIPEITLKCPFCKGRIVRSEDIPHRTPYEVVCPHCELKIWVRSTLKIKHRLSVQKNGLQRKKNKSATRDKIEYLDSLWSELIKAKAGYKCEITGVPASEYPLNSHHLSGKKTHYMRYLVQNGISITSGLHLMAHSSSQVDRDEFAEKAKRVKGQNIFEKLKYLEKVKRKKTNLALVERYLKNQLKLYG